MQAIAKLHSYCVTNTFIEMNYAYTDLTPEFYKAVRESFNELADISDDEIKE